MARLENTIEIAAPPERVFAFFVPQRMVYWYGMDMEAEFEVQGDAAEFQPGQKVRISGRAWRRELSLTAVVTRYAWGRALEWQFLDPYGVRGREAWELESTPAGTRVRMRNEYEMPGRLGRLFDALFTRHAVARRARLYLSCLRRLAERR